jgi:hypothetical protein
VGTSKESRSALPAQIEEWPFECQKLFDGILKAQNCCSGSLIIEQELPWGLKHMR